MVLVLLFALAAPVAASEDVPVGPMVPVVVSTPLFCANAREPDNASAAAKPMVVSFMRCPLARKGTTAAMICSFQTISLSAIEASKPFTFLASASLCARTASQAGQIGRNAYVKTKQAYKDRNVIERCYARLKDFRRIATRYDKLARNYFSALCLVAAV